jgi:hypothetical protein
MDKRRVAGIAERRKEGTGRISGNASTIAAFIRRLVAQIAAKSLGMLLRRRGNPAKSMPNFTA